MEPVPWAEAHGLSRYFGTSLKGERPIDWDDPVARRQLLGSVVADAEGLLEATRQALAAPEPEGRQHQRLREAANLLAQLLLQNVEQRPDGPALKEGVSPDRVVSVHDPEMRHGRKSASQRFDGHKAAIAVDPESQLITAAGLVAARARGKKGGRPKALTPRQQSIAKALYTSKQHSVAEICRTLKISRATLYRYIKIGERY